MIRIKLSVFFLATAIAQIAALPASHDPEWDAHNTQGHVAQPLHDFLEHQHGEQFVNPQLYVLYVQSIIIEIVTNVCNTGSLATTLVCPRSQVRQVRQVREYHMFHHPHPSH